MGLSLEEYIEEREEILNRVRQMLIRDLRLQRSPDEIDPDTPLFGSGLGFDSVDAVELMVALDVNFGVLLPNNAAGRASLRTVNTLVDLIVSVRTGDNGE